MPSIPVGYGVDMKETSDDVKQLLRCMKYDEHQWQLCGDLKVVALARIRKKKATLVNS